MATSWEVLAYYWTGSTTKDFTLQKGYINSGGWYTPVTSAFNGIGDSDSSGSTSKMYDLFQNMTASWTIDADDTYAEWKAHMESVFPVLKNVRIWVCDSATNNPYVKTNPTWTQVFAHISGVSETSAWYIFIEFLSTDVEGTDMSYCTNGIHYRWDDTGDDLYVVNAGVETMIVTNTATDQAAVKSILEGIYPIGTWKYAWNTTTGEICVVYDGTGVTTFNYDVILSDVINLSAGASAYIVSRYPVNYEKWVL